MNLEGVELKDLKVISDERGAVLHMMKSVEPEFTQFGEVYFSKTNPGVIKGWKCHKLQTQNFTVPVGRLRIVLFDNRADSSTKGKVQEVELSPENYQRLRIPPMIWYSFGTIGNEVAMIANFTDIPHDPNESSVLPLETDEIPFDWRG